VDIPGGFFGGQGVTQSGLFNASISGPGTHSIIYFNYQNGCLFSDTILMEVVNQNSITLNGLSNYCAIDSVISLAFGSPLGGSYKIDGVSYTSSFNPIDLASGSHTLTYTYTWEDNCTFSKDQQFFIIPIPPKPILEAPEGLIACEGDSILLKTTLFPFYSWNNGAISPEIIVKESGQYSVFFRSNIGCYSFSDTISVVFSPPFSLQLNSPLYDNGFAISEYGANDGVIEIVVDGGVSPFSVDIIPNVGLIDQLTISNLSYGSYLLTLIDQVGCIVSDSMRLFQPDIEISPIDSTFFLPNAFTPNGDGFNDFYSITDLLSKYRTNTFQVWDIARQLVYSANNYANTWDGKDMKGNRLLSGTYFAVFTSPELKEPAKTFIDLRYE
jgi:gliding motility-associated-like protein